MHKTYITDHQIGLQRIEWTPTTFVQARLHDYFLTFRVLPAASAAEGLLYCARRNNRHLSLLLHSEENRHALHGERYATLVSLDPCFHQMANVVVRYIRTGHSRNIYWVPIQPLSLCIP